MKERLTRKRFASYERIYHDFGMEEGIKFLHNARERREFESYVKMLCREGFLK